MIRGIDESCSLLYKYKHMKVKSIILGWLCLLMITGCCTRKIDEITVVSYNIRVPVVSDGTNAWPNRKGATVSMIHRIRPDLLGLQEATMEQIEYIVAHCPSYGWYGVGREDGKQEGENMAIFYRKEAFNLLDSLTYWLSETPDVPSKGWDAACQRTATVCFFEHKESGKKFYYVNTHLDHRGEEARQNGLQLIVDNISKMNPKGYPLILSGDFNMNASHPAILNMENIMLNTRKVAPITDNYSTFNAWKEERRDSVNNMWILDYIFYSPQDSDMCKEYRTITESFANIPFISDHYPILTRLQLK